MNPSGCRNSPDVGDLGGVRKLYFRSDRENNNQTTLYSAAHFTGESMTSFGVFSRRTFLNHSKWLLAAPFASRAWGAGTAPFKAKISAHVWVYASKYPPDWDATPDLERIFSDLHQAGMDGVELMEVMLRHDDAVAHLTRLEQQYNLPVTGASYGAAMWDRSKHAEILPDVTLVVERLGKLNAKTLGISVGDAGHVKTQSELDAQADLLRKIQKICADHGIVPNLHNHTYEVANNLHDLKGTLARIPNIKLGPDLNWLIRGGVDPVWFIKTYGHQMVYMHIRDQYKDGTWTEYVGQGATDFPAIAAALRSVDFRGRAAIELAFENPFVPKNPLAEDWKLSVEYVRKTFGW
jgi:sugar phosphate isomerase/epimerase